MNTLTKELEEQLENLANDIEVLIIEYKSEEETEGLEDRFKENVDRIFYMKKELPELQELCDQHELNIHDYLTEEEISFVEAVEDLSERAIALKEVEQLQAIPSTKATAGRVML